MRKINRAGEGHSPAPAGRKVNVSNSRRESQPGPRRGREPKEPKEPCEKGRHPILRFIGRTIATLICLGIMAGSLVAVGAVYYVVQATANDGDLLDLDNIELSQSSVVMATDPDTGAQVEYATLRSSNSHRVWADLEQIPTNLQYAFICTEDKDFYNEPGVNFKRTIGAMVNEYLLPIYSSKQGASTLEQQLIKNLTDDKSASGIEGALRKLREIYRALCLSRSYSKETILEAYLNTISFTGTIQGVQTAANEYFNKDVSQLTLWECATIASITKNPTNYNPYTNPENLINRRNFLMYNMWQQGVISEEDYRNAAAQPLVLAEEEDTKKNSSVTSYFTDALFTELVQDIMDKENISESEAQKLLYTGGFTVESTVNTKAQSAMENLMLNTDDAYFPAGWHEEEVTSISDDDVQVMNEDGTPKTRTGDDGTVYYYRNVRTQAAMVTLDYDGNVIAIVGGLGEKNKSLSLNRAYSVNRQTGSTIKPIGAYALGVEYGLVNWSTMLNNSPLYQKQDMVIRDEDYCRKNGLMGLSDSQLKAYPNAWRSWPRNYGGNYGDGSDLPLCAEGRAQLEELKAKFQYPDVPLVFCSPMLRAQQTAEVLFPNAKLTILQDLREMNFGKFENRPITELVKDPEFAQWMDPTSRTNPDGAEDRKAFYDRTNVMLMKLFEYQLRTHTEEAACITHGGVIMNMMANHVLPQHKPEEWMTDPGCGYSLRLDAEMWMRDHIAEAFDIVPYGYLDGAEE